MRNWKALFHLLFAACFAASAVASEQLATWQWRNPLPTGNHLAAAAYGNGQWVVVGENGAILVSSNAVSWTAVPSPVIDLSDVVFDAGRFVAVGNYGRILWSTNGLSWTETASGTFYPLFGVTAGQGRFVAVGSNALIFTSPDGNTWSQSGGGEFRFVDVAYGNGRFVAVGDGRAESIFQQADGIVYTSEDGTRWRETARIPEGQFTAVSFGGGVFVAGTQRGQLLWSVDGSVWRAAEQDISFFRIKAIGYGEEKFVAFDGLFETNTLAYTQSAFVSEDFGRTWKTHRLPAREFIQDVAWGEGQFVAVGGRERERPPALLRSEDGASWTTASSMPLGSVEKIAVAGNQFLAFAHRLNSDFSSSGVWAAQSVDGVAWESAPFQPNWIPSDHAYFKGQHIVVGNGIAVSGNGVDWVQTATNAQMVAVAAGPDTVVAAWENGFFLVSTNGTNWATVNPRLLHNFYDVTWGNGHFLAAASNGDLFSSANGMEWTVLQLEGDLRPWFSKLAFGNGRFFGVSGNYGWVSTNGMDWKGLILPIWAADIAFMEGRFIAAGGMATGRLNHHGRGYIIESFDGLSWTLREAGSAGRLKQALLKNNGLLALDDSGGLLQRGPEIASEHGAPVSLRMDRTGLLTIVGNAGTKLDIGHATQLRPENWVSWTNLVLPTSIFTLETGLDATSSVRFFRATSLP